MVCNKSQEKVESIIPGRETSSGLTHFYKDGGRWKFLAEEEYETRKSELPGLSFAVKYPFSQFEQKAATLSDLTELMQSIGVDEAAIVHREVTSTHGRESIPAGEPLYYSSASIND